MPYIDAKLTGTVTPAQREVLKNELGQAIALMDKPESFLMIGFQDNYDLYFGGNRLEKGAYVSIAMLGEPDREKNAAMTARVTEIMSEVQNTRLRNLPPPLKRTGLRSCVTRL